MGQVMSEISGRYWAFMGDAYYPLGGMEDFVGDFNSLEEAIQFIAQKAKAENYRGTMDAYWCFAWAHIWDTETLSEAWRK